MPSPTIGWASPAALPMRKMPSPCPSRTPGRIGPVASQGPSRSAPCERGGDAGAFAAQDRLEHVAGALAGIRLAIAAEPVFADAAGERGDAVVGDDHAAVAAGERQHRQQVGLDRAAAKVGLEGEQVARPALLAAHRALRGQRLPRAVRGDDERGLDARSRRRPRRPTASADESDRPRPRSPAARTAGTGSRRPAPPGATSKVSSCSRPSARPKRRPGASAGGSGATTLAAPRISATRRSSAPARRSTSAPTPSASSSARLLAAMHSPQTLRRGKRWRSISATDQPARASRIAAAEPAGPAPTIATSKRALIDPGRRPAWRRSSG